MVLNFPVLSMLITSLKSDAEITSNASLLIERPTLANYAHVFAMADRFDFMRFLENSVIEAGLGTAFSIGLALPAAYAIVRFRAGESCLLPTIANLRAISLIVFSIPIYLMYQQAHLLDTRLGLTLILCLVNLPLVLVLLANATQDLPIELDEAARIDGASTWSVLLQIVLPLLRPIMAASVVLAFIYSWNEFLFGLMLTTSVAAPVTVGASFFFSASVRWGVAASVMILSLAPTLLLGLGAYRHIGRSMTAGAVKG